MSLPHKVTFPEVSLLKPVIADTNSVCPLPSIPARQTISPALTLNETSEPSYCKYMKVWAVLKGSSMTAPETPSWETFASSKTLLKPSINATFLSTYMVFT